MKAPVSSFFNAFSVFENFSFCFYETGRLHYTNLPSISSHTPSPPPFVPCTTSKGTYFEAVFSTLYLKLYIFFRDHKNFAASLHLYSWDILMPTNIHTHRLMPPLTCVNVRICVHICSHICTWTCHSCHSCVGRVCVKPECIHLSWAQLS